MIVGGGGREHALAWICADDPQVSQVFVAPGNPGTAAEDKVVNLPFGSDDFAQLLAFAAQERPDLAIIGPEQPIADGLADRMREQGVPCLAPSAAAAQLESSKSFAKDFMQRHGIPTAEYAVFDDAAEARDWARQRDCPLAVKADGLAAGKGVVLTKDAAEAVRAIDWMHEGDALGGAGRRIVLEEFLHGREASFILMSDGQQVLPLATSEDHKARDDGDVGPNTGGMGACSPSPAVNPNCDAMVMQQVVMPTIRGIAAEGHPLTGFLYCGLMISADGRPRVLEYNCRLGDPEAQVLLFRYRGSHFAELCLAAAKGQLASQPPLPLSLPAATGVVLAAEGYPGSYARGAKIEGMDNLPEDIKVFHAGTALDDRGRLVTAGGRVLCVTAGGDSLADARARAYEGVQRISWPGAFCRRDIGARGPWPPTGEGQS